MTQEERYGIRDGSYSAWHRRNSTKRYVGIENAQLLAMIDLDASLYVEYDDGTKEPLALIEIAKDIGQSYKCATVTKKLAERAGLPGWVVLYKVSDRPNPADIRWPDILEFRVQRLTPNPHDRWYTVTPNQWAVALLKMRREQSQRVDCHN